MIDTDGVLFRRYRSTGDRDAFEALFRKYQGPIYGLIVRLVGSEEAYDLTQEVFLRVLRSVQAFRGDCTFRTWLYTIARHVCYNHCRDSKRRQAIEGLFGGSDDDGESQEQEIPDTQMSVERIVETQELQRVVASILETMTVEQRLLITLRDFEGMSYEEMTQITDLSLVNVKSKLHRARLAFKAKFEPYWKALQDGDNDDARGNEAERIGGKRLTGGEVGRPATTDVMESSGGSMQKGRR
jgi:RNA polymerase sigma-70 factor (ECF subfamily)